MVKFWVIGGTYKDSSFAELAPGTKEVREGPFDSYEAANKAWQAQAWSTVDDALAQFHIEEEEMTPSDGSTVYWVTGGRYMGGSFEELDGPPESYGPFATHEEAKAKWSELAWQTVDEANARYRIESLSKASEQGEPQKLSYRLLTGTDDLAFCTRVSEALADGYELYGSPAISQGEQGVQVCQAVILKD